MRSRAFLLTLAMAAWHSIPAQITAAVTTAQRDAIVDTVRKATADFLAAAQSVDADKFGSFLTTSPDYAYAAQDGSICRTPQVCLRLTKEGWSDVQSMQIRVTDAKIAVPSPTVAVETMSISGDVVPKSGKTMTIDKAALTIVWVRETTGWKILSLQQSYPPPKTND